MSRIRGSGRLVVLLACLVQIGQPLSSVAATPGLVQVSHPGAVIAGPGRSVEDDIPRLTATPRIVMTSRESNRRGAQHPPRMRSSGASVLLNNS